MIDYSKVTAWTWCYLLCWLVMSIGQGVWVVVLYCHGYFDLNANKNEEGHTMYAMKLVAMYKIGFVITQLLGHGFVHAQLRFIKNPQNMCPVFLFSTFIKMWTRSPNSRKHYALAMQSCSLTCILAIIGELQVINVLYYEHWSFFVKKPNYVAVLVLGSQVIEILSTFYVIGYRNYKGFAWFYDLFFWDDMIEALNIAPKSSTSSTLTSSIKSKNKDKHTTVDIGGEEISQPLSPRTSKKLESMWKNNPPSANGSGNKSCSVGDKVHYEKSKSILSRAASHELELAHHMGGIQSPRNIQIRGLSQQASTDQENIQVDHDDVEFEFSQLDDGITELQFNPIEEKRTLCQWIGLGITRIIGGVVIFLFVLFLILLILVVLVGIYFRIYILGKLLCMDYCCDCNKSLKLRLKRASDNFNYILFVLLFETINFDVLLKFLVEHEPTKYYLTHGAIVFFHNKYIQYAKSCLPDYSLIHDYTTYDV